MTSSRNLQNDITSQEDDELAECILIFKDRLNLVISPNMIVRESPSPKKASPDSNAQWPPRSARDALLGSPSGAKRVQQANAPGSMSPSPSKRRRLAKPADEATVDDSEMDEETLRLELQAIEARLRLKKLQKAKNEAKSSAMSHRDAEARTSSKETASNDESKQQQHVQVPSSPKASKPATTNTNVRQPSKQVQLGIDKGVSAHNMSLKRPRTAVSTTSEAALKPVKSFSQRLSDSRSEDIARQEKQRRLEQRQNNSFGVSNPARGEKKKDNGTPLHAAKTSSGIEPIVGKQNKFSQSSSTTKKDASLSSHQPVLEPEATESFDPYSGFTLSQRSLNHETLTTGFEDKELMPIPRLLKTVVSPNFEPPDLDRDYVVFGVIAHKSLPHEHAVKHQSKSNADPDDPDAPKRSKFMVLKLTDLTWELDCFLFDSAFEEFKKLAVGTIVALLNPDVMPPKPAFRDTGKFSLKVCSNQGTLLEIGKSKDLIFCRATRKDGHTCTQWIDGRKTEFCEFHINERSIKAKVHRMEVNTMASLGSFGQEEKRKKQEKREKDQKSYQRWLKKNKKEGGGDWEGKRKYHRQGLNSGTYVDSFAGEIGYVIPKQYTNEAQTSRLLDAEDYVHGGLSKEERSRRRLAETQKEHELARALGANGSGIGQEYMRSRDPKNAEDEAAKASDKASKGLDATSLGLVCTNAADVKLSPVGKRRKLGANTAEPVGWSGAFKRGLLSPSRNENIAPPKTNGSSVPSVSANVHEPAGKSVSPNKQARFLLKEKGIRVPGRDSEVGTITNGTNDDDDDDGLDIVY